MRSVIAASLVHRQASGLTMAIISYLRLCFRSYTLQDTKNVASRGFLITG